MKVLRIDQKKIDFLAPFELKEMNTCVSLLEFVAIQEQTMTEAVTLFEKLDQLERYAKERKEEAEKVLIIANIILNKIAEIRPRAKAINSDQENIELLEDYSNTLKRLLKDWDRLMGSDTL